MPIKRVRIDPSKLGISAQPEVDHRQLIEQSQWSAGAKIAAARSADATSGLGAKQIYQKITQRGLTLSLNDLMGMPMGRGPQLSRSELFQGMDMGRGAPGRQMLTEEFPTDHDYMVMENDEYGGYYGDGSLGEDYESPPPRRQSQQPIRHPPIQRQPMQPRAQPQTRPQQPQQLARQALREQIIGAPPTRPTQATSGPPWGVRAYLGETRGGSKVHVWRVANAKTGTELETMFRVESVAARVAQMLNESGDSNDPRALSLINVYNKRDQLLKEAKAIEKTLVGEPAKPMKTQRLNAIRSEINQLDYRLGI